MVMVFANVLEDRGASTCSVCGAHGKVVCDVHCVSVVRDVNWKTHLSAGNVRVLDSS